MQAILRPIFFTKQATQSPNDTSSTLVTFKSCQDALDSCLPAVELIELLNEDGVADSIEADLGYTYDALAPEGEPFPAETKSGLGKEYIIGCRLLMLSLCDRVFSVSSLDSCGGRHDSLVALHAHPQVVCAREAPAHAGLRFARLQPCHASRVLARVQHDRDKLAIINQRLRSGKTLSRTQQRELERQTLTMSRVPMRNNPLYKGPEPSKEYPDHMV